MDVRFTDEQELLRRSVREVLARECPIGRVREYVEGPSTLGDELWKRAAELGWTGLALPEAHGGAGLGLQDLGLVLAEMGRVLAPGPYFASVALAAVAVGVGGNTTQQERILPAIASGGLRATLALLEEGGSWEPDSVRLAARETASGFELTGTKLFVPDAESADLLVVAACSGAGLELLVVPASAPGLSVRPIAFVDGTRRLSEVRFDAVAAPRDARLGAAGGGAPLLEAVLDRAKVALCAETCGGAERVLELTVAYAKTREQFGQAIGSFQAIQHKCADMLVQIEGMKSATWYAAWAIDQGEPDAHVAACMAKAFCSDGFRRIAGEGIQIHGGLGFTWEQDPQLYYKRAKASELLLGDASFNRELVARVLLDRD